MNTSRRWMNLMRFSLNVAVSLQTIWIRSERTPFSNGGHSTTRNRSKLAQKGSAKPFMRKAYHASPLDSHHAAAEPPQSHLPGIKVVRKNLRFAAHPLFGTIFIAPRYTEFAF